MESSSGFLELASESETPPADRARAVRSGAIPRSSFDNFIFMLTPSFDRRYRQSLISP
jgi:hypothetical protein